MAFKEKQRNFIKQTLLRECNKCWYCGIDLNKVEIHIEHIIPKSRGGSDDLSNMALVCNFCNMAKQDMDLISFLNWLSHIRSGEFNCYIVKKLEIQLECRTNDKLQKSYYA